MAMNMKLLDLDSPGVVNYRYIHQAEIGDSSISLESRDLNTDCNSSKYNKPNVACIRLDKNEMYVVLRGTIRIFANKRIMGGRLDAPFGTFDEEN